MFLLTYHSLISEYTGIHIHIIGICYFLLHTSAFVNIFERPLKFIVYVIRKRARFKMNSVFCGCTKQRNSSTRRFLFLFSQ